MADEVAIRVENVSKNFKLPHERHNSLKSKIVHAFGRTKGFQTQRALKNVSFEIKKGEFFGIVGRNGSGKSTMLKMLAGIYQPTEGKISVSGKLVPFIELGVGFNPELTGRENVFLNGALLGFTNKQVAKMYDDIVEFAELEKFMDQKLKNYSSGMQVRLAFSMAVRADADVLLIDEVLAVGDADFQRKCYDYFKKLKGERATVVFVTHEMSAVREYCDRALLIESSKVIKLGDPETIATLYTKMFSKTRSEAFSSIEKKRWGDKNASYAQLKVTPNFVDDGSSKVSITAVVEVRKDLPDILLGFKIRDDLRRDITGCNNIILRKKITKLKKGDILNLEWAVPNIFSDGKYYVDVTAEDGESIETYDWWKGAVTFEVRKTAKSSFVVAPLTKLEIQVNGKDFEQK